MTSAIPAPGRIWAIGVAERLIGKRPRISPPVLESQSLNLASRNASVEVVVERVTGALAAGYEPAAFAGNL
jgi:hypothetical protein